MPKRRIAIEIEFEDDFALLDFQERGLDVDLLDKVAEHLADQLPDRVRVSADYLCRNNLTGAWGPYGLGPARPSELAIARVMAKDHPDKTHWETSRERLEKVEAERAEQRRKDAEYLEALRAEEAENAAPEEEA